MTYVGPTCSFAWHCPTCSAGSVIKAQVEQLTLDEATGIIAHKHVEASPDCQAWEDITCINLGGCPYFGEVAVYVPPTVN